MSIATGDAIENRYVLDVPRGDTTSGPEWQAIDMLLHRRVIVVLGRRPARPSTDADSPDGDNLDTAATAPLPIPVSDGRQVLDGGVHDGRAYLVVAYDHPAPVEELSTGADPAPTSETPTTGPMPLDLPTYWASAGAATPGVRRASAARSGRVLGIVGALTVVAVVAALFVFTAMGRDPDTRVTDPTAADTAPATTTPPAEVNAANPASPGPVAADNAPRRSPNPNLVAADPGASAGQPPTDLDDTPPTTTATVSPTTNVPVTTGPPVTATPTTALNTPPSTNPDTAPAPSPPPGGGNAPPPGGVDVGLGVDASQATVHGSVNPVGIGVDIG